MLSAASSERNDSNVVSSLNQFNITSVFNSPVKHEMMLLSSLMTKLVLGDEATLGRS
jgi:hypothetical protein